MESAGPIDVVVNNAKINPTMNALHGKSAGAFEDNPLESWSRELAVGLTDAMPVRQVFGTSIAARARALS